MKSKGADVFMKAVLGADVGTGGIRVGIYDLEGHELGSGSCEYETWHEHSGWAEQRPSDWWEAFRHAVSQALRESGLKKEDIISLGVDTHGCSPVMCRRDGTPLRNCIIWMDVRSAAYSKYIKEETGYQYTAEWMPPKLLWLKNNEPEIYEKTEVIADCYSWLVYKLTRKWCYSTMPVHAWGYDPDTNNIARDFYERIGLGDALSKFIGFPAVPPGTPVSRLDYEAAQFLGLSTETLVVSVGVDSPIGLLGMGAYKPGRITLMTGSSHLIMALSDKPLNTWIYKAYTGQVVPGYYYTFQGQVSTGSVTSWFKRELASDIANQAHKEGKSTYAILDELASKVPAGSEGLIVLEYWQGVREPYHDSHVRGMIYGLSLNHTRGHIFRAIMEGIAYGTNRNLDVYREQGYEINEIVVAGGAAYSDIFLQIHADVAGCPLLVPENKQACAFGTAITCAVGAGCYQSFEEAVNRMVRFEKRIEPDPENVDKYKGYYEQYKEAYPLMSDWMHEVYELNK